MIPKETYEQELKRLDEKLAAAIKEQGTPSLFQGWDPAEADADDTEMSVFNGGKKKSKRTKSKKSKKSKSKKSKRTKK